jgi:hypothetical protein
VRDGVAPLAQTHQPHEALDLLLVVVRPALVGLERYPEGAACLAAIVGLAVDPAAERVPRLHRQHLVEIPSPTRGWDELKG